MPPPRESENDRQCCFEMLCEWASCKRSIPPDHTPLKSSYARPHALSRFWKSNWAENVERWKGARDNAFRALHDRNANLPGISAPLQALQTRLAGHRARSAAHATSQESRLCLNKNSSASLPCLTRLPHCLLIVCLTACFTVGLTGCLTACLILCWQTNSSDATVTTPAGHSAQTV